MNGYYIAAPLQFLRQGVANDVFYPQQEIDKCLPLWDGIPIQADHSMDGATIGFVVDPRPGGDGFIHATGMFDVQLTQAADPDIVQKLQSGQPLPLSEAMRVIKKVPHKFFYFRGQRYSHIATEIRPLHLTLVVQGVPAVGIEQGQGINIPPERRATKVL